MQMFIGLGLVAVGAFLVFSANRPEPSKALICTIINAKGDALTSFIVVGSATTPITEFPSGEVTGWVKIQEAE
jgi:hypothetical protein